MKKFIAVIFSFFLLSANMVFADGDLWDNYGDHNAYGRKPVTEEEFNKALESKQRHKPKKFKGEEFHQSNETDFIKQFKTETPVLCIPVNLIVNQNKILPIGHYQVVGEKKDGKPILRFYQAHDLIAEIPAVETNEDYGQESVHFVELLENGGKQVKIIFGSLDFNAYSLIDIAD